MKVLFANPPTFRNNGRFNRPTRCPTFYDSDKPVLHPPILLAYAASFIRSRGHDVRLIDAQAEGVDVEGFLSRVAGFGPDFLVMETSTPSFYDDAKVAAMAKDAVPQIKAIMVGPHVSALPEESLKESSLDVVVMGEYELALAEYVERGCKDTGGICFRQNGQVILNRRREYLQHLDSLPFPARELLPNDKYYDPIMKNPFTIVVGGRGCPYGCTFCNWPQVMTGRGYRRRSPGNITEELETIQRDYKFKSFQFDDSTFTVNRYFALEVCREMVSRGIKIPWGCYSRADIRDIELLKALREAGCFLLKIGIESGSQKILKTVEKGYELEEVLEGVRVMKELGFHVDATFILGLPGETMETIKETINFAKELGPTTVRFQTAVPYPETVLYHYLRREGLLPHGNSWDEYFPLNPIFGYPDLSAEEIVNAAKRAKQSSTSQYCPLNRGVQME